MCVFKLNKSQEDSEKQQNWTKQLDKKGLKSKEGYACKDMPETDCMSYMNGETGIY